MSLQLETDRNPFSFSAPKMPILSGFCYFRFSTESVVYVFSFFVFGQKRTSFRPKTVFYKSQNAQTMDAK